MKKIKWLFSFLTSVLLLIGCGGQNVLQQQLVGIKEQMPFKITEWATVSDIGYADNTLTVNITVSEGEQLTMARFKENSADITKALGDFIFGSKGSLHSLAPAIKATNTAVCLKLIGSSSKETVECKVPAAEAARWADGTSALEQLQTRITMDNLTIPYDVNEFLKHAPRTIEGDDVVITLLVKGSSFDKNLSSKELKKFFTEIFTDPTDGVSDYAALCIAAGKKAKWVYKNESSGAQLTYTFGLEELKQIAEQNE